MKKKSTSLNVKKFPRLLITGCGIVIFLILLLVLQKLTPQSKDTKPLVALVNIDEKKQSIQELAIKINTLPQTDPNRVQAEKITQKALGIGAYSANVSTLNYPQLFQSPTAMTTGLVPLGLRSAQLCSAKNDRSSCKQDIGILEDKIDIAERLIKYYAILSHIPDLCVKADLGTKPHLNATAIDGNTSRLNICTGAPGDIKFRAAAKNGKMVRVKESYTPDISGSAITNATTCLLKTLPTIKCASEE